MGIFSNFNIETEIDVPVLEGYGPEQNGEMRIVRESFEDQLEVIKAFHALDMAEIAGNKAVMEGASQEEVDIVMEGMVANAWTKIKEFFQKLLAKVKSYFEALVRMFDAMTKSTKEFITKYESKLKVLKLEGFEYAIVEYNNSALESTSVANAFNEVVSYVDGLSGDEYRSDDKEKIHETINGKLVGKGALDSEEYSNALYAYFRKDVDSPEDTIDERKIAISTIITEMKSTKATDNAGKAKKEAMKIFSDKIKEVEKLERAKNKEKATTSEAIDAQSKALKEYQGKLSLYNEANTAALKFFSAWSSAIKKRDADYKRVCLAAFSYKKKD